MPGVRVGVGPAPATADLADPRGTTFFVVGQAERGPVTGDAVLVTSLARFEEIYGGFVGYGALYDAVATYFGEGGARVQVARVAGAAAAVGLLALADRAGAPVPTLRIDASSPGAWSSRVTIEIANGTVAGTFTLTVRYDGVVREVFADLASPAAAVAALDTSSFVRGVNLASGTVAPNNNPAVLAATPLSAGTDDRAAVVTATYTDALARFTTAQGTGVVAIPGQPSSAVGAALAAHAAATFREAATAAAVASTPTAVRAAAVALKGIAGAEGLGLFWPWVRVPDRSGGVRTVSPEGYHAGVRARTLSDFGPGQSPAGVWGQARYVLGLEQTASGAPLDVSDVEGDDLNNTYGVNVIRTIAGSTRIYGDRSMSLDRANYYLLKDRRVVNHVATAGDLALEDLVFGRIDGNGVFNARVATRLLAIVLPLAVRGDVFPLVVNGAQVDPGYVVDVGEGVNTVQTLAANEFHARVGVRPSPTAEIIYLDIAKYRVGQAA